jgi:hypothetical protein
MIGDLHKNRCLKQGIEKQHHEAGSITSCLDNVAQYHSHELRHPKAQMGMSISATQANERSTCWSKPMTWG